MEFSLILAEVRESNHILGSGNGENRFESNHMFEDQPLKSYK